MNETQFSTETRINLALDQLKTNKQNKNLVPEHEI